MIKIIRSHKIRLRLTKEQEQLVCQYSKVARKFWNLLVELDQLNAEKALFDNFLLKGDKLTNGSYYSKHFKRSVLSITSKGYLHLVKYYVKKIKKDDNNFDWYRNGYNSFIYNFIAREFIKIKISNKGKVKFRSQKKIDPSFPIRCDSTDNRLSRIYLKDNKKLQIPTLGEVKYGSKRPDFDLSCKKQTAKVSFDGKYWYLSYSEDIDKEPINNNSNWSEGVGIDLGIKTLAQVSDGTSYPNIKTFRRVRLLNKRLKRLQRKLSRKYLINKSTKNNKTKNIIKLEKKIKLIYRTIKNIRINHIRELTARIVKKQPIFISLEDLNIKGMMKNKFLAKDIANNAFYNIREHLTRKAKERKISVRIVNRFYPSSKTCSGCGDINKSLKLKDRIFTCNNCRLKIDRDLNASINLRNTNNYNLA